jgi:hypothetical protein
MIMTARIGRRPALFDRLSQRISRRGLVKGGGFIGAGTLLAQSGLLRSAAQDNPGLIETMNAAITLEAFAVTFYGAARGRGGDLELEDDVTRFIRAAQCEEEAHYHFFEAAGAVPSRNTFTVTDRRVSTQNRFLSALLQVETLLVGAHMATARQFAAAGELRLVEIAYQIGAVEAQHQAMTRLFLGERLGADRAFAGWMFRDPAEAIAALIKLGYIDGNGDAYTYPGPVDRNCRGVSGLVAETTEDQPVEGEPPDASPVASPTGVSG